MGPKLISLPQLVKILLVSLLWILHLQPVEKAKEQALSPLKKLDTQGASALCREFVEQNLVPRIFPPALAKMRTHHLAGDVVLLVSASRLLSVPDQAFPAGGRGAGHHHG